MLHTFLAEEQERQTRLYKQQREPKKDQNPSKAKMRDASIQCAPVQLQSAVAAIQMDFSGDIVQELKEQVLNLTKIVSELMAYKSQENTRKIPPGSFLTELLTDSLDDLKEVCPDSYESASATSPETPLSGLMPSNKASVNELHHQPRYNSSPFCHLSRAPLRAIDENCVPSSLTEQQQSNVDGIVFKGTQMSTTALACVDVLFTETDLANGNTGGTFAYQKLDEHKIRYLSSALRQKFNSPSFESQWEAVHTKINAKCRGKRRTMINRLKTQVI